MKPHRRCFEVQATTNLSHPAPWWMAILTGLAMRRTMVLACLTRRD